MRPSVHLPLLFALASGATAAFTSPDPDVPLNVSAPTITIAWTKPDPPSSNFRYLTLDMQFITTKDENTTTGWTDVLASNLTLDAGEFEWDPTKVREFLENETNTTEQRDDARVSFMAAMRGPADGGFVTILSETYEIGGYEGYESLVAPVLPAWLLLAAGLVTAVQF